MGVVRAKTDGRRFEVSWARPIHPALDQCRTRGGRGVADPCRIWYQSRQTFRLDLHHDPSRGGFPPPFLSSSIRLVILRPFCFDGYIRHCETGTSRDPVGEVDGPGPDPVL